MGARKARRGPGEPGGWEVGRRWGVARRARDYSDAGDSTCGPQCTKLINRCQLNRMELDEEYLKVESKTLIFAEQ